MPMFRVRRTRTEYKFIDLEIDAGDSEQAEVLAKDVDVYDEEWEIGNAEEDIQSVRMM